MRPSGRAGALRRRFRRDGCDEEARGGRRTPGGHSPAATEAGATSGEDGTGGLEPGSAGVRLSRRPLEQAPIGAHLGEGRAKGLLPPAVPEPGQHEAHPAAGEGTDGAKQERCEGHPGNHPRSEPGPAGMGEPLQSGNAAKKANQGGTYLRGRLRRFLVKRQGRNLQAGIRTMPQPERPAVSRVRVNPAHGLNGSSFIHPCLYWPGER